MNKTTEAHSQAPTQSQENTSNIQSPTLPMENEAVKRLETRYKTDLYTPHETKDMIC